MNQIISYVNYVIYNTHQINTLNIVMKLLVNILKEITSLLNLITMNIFKNKNKKGLININKKSNILERNYKIV